MLQDVPSVANSQRLRDVPDVAVNGTVAGNHANMSCMYICMSVSAFILFINYVIYFWFLLSEN